VKSEAISATSVGLSPTIATFSNGGVVITRLVARSSLYWVRQLADKLKATGEPVEDALECGKPELGSVDILIHVLRFSGLAAASAASVFRNVEVQDLPFGLPS
jgi:hypothetical protein